MNGTYVVINQKKKLMNVTFNVFYATSLLQKKTKVLCTYKQQAQLQYRISIVFFEMR